LRYPDVVSEKEIEAEAEDDQLERNVLAIE
jgi:hypothetical protein